MADFIRRDGLRARQLNAVSSEQGASKIGLTAAQYAKITEDNKSYDLLESKRLANGPYKHEPVAPTPISGSTAAPNIKLDFQPNILDNYDTATYHFKLFMTSIENSGTGQFLKSENQTVIAESGVTDLTIDKVEFRGITVPSVEAGTGTQTSVKFEIVEPSGAGLMDQMFYEAVALGIGNWFVMPVYLQLEFKVRNPDTSETGGEDVDGIGKLRWVWALKISDVKANVTTVGTRYAFEAIIYNEYGQSNAMFSLQHNASLDNLETFGDAMKDLEKKLNDDQLLKLIDNYSIPDEYEIIVDDKIKNYKITPNSESKNPMRNNSYTKFNNKTATFNANTSVDKIIDTLLANTNEYQMYFPDAPSPGADGRPLSSETHQMKKLWRTITETRPIGFDKRRQNNVVKVTIYVIEYKIGVMDANVTQSTNPEVSKEASTKRFAAYVNDGVLKKKYNYLFTGLNDQILNFDLTLNFAFATAVARFDGKYLNPAIRDVGVTGNKNTPTDADVKSALSKAMSFQFDPKNANSKESEKAQKEFTEALSKSSIPDDSKQRYSNLLFYAKPENKAAVADNVRKYGITNDGNINYDNSVRSAKSLATPMRTDLPGFISDVNIRSNESKSAYNDFINSSKAVLRPIAQSEQSQDQGPAGLEANANAGINKIATLFSTALHSSLDANLQQIKMTIKGDPFWIFPHPVQADVPFFKSLWPGDADHTKAINFFKKSHIDLSPMSVNAYGTDNFILLRFRTPRNFRSVDDVDNVNPFSEVETFSGVYRVITIVSKFEMGKFSQDLECLLDPIINLKDIGDLIEKDAALKDKKYRPEDASKINDLPYTAIKYGRMEGGSSILDPRRLDRPGAGKEAGGGRGFVNPTLASNIPSAVSNTLNGLPDKFK